MAPFRVWPADGATVTAAVDETFEMVKGVVALKPTQDGRVMAVEAPEGDIEV